MSGAGSEAGSKGRSGGVLEGVAEGGAGRVLADTAARGQSCIHIARDDVRLSQVIASAQFFAPGLRVLAFPAWDCLPYDRSSPRPEIAAQRLAALSRLTARGGEKRLAARGGEKTQAPVAVITTVSAVLQRCPPPELFTGRTRALAPGERISQDDLAVLLVQNGCRRAETVMTPGEFAVRGGIVDIFAPGAESPVRADFFGDEIESLRAFDPATQRTSGPCESVELGPTSEVLLDAAAITRFREGYRTLFSVSGGDDALYTEISAGQRPAGLEHWLPLFHEKLVTLFDYLEDAAVTEDFDAGAARLARFDVISDHYTARTEALAASSGRAGYDGAPVYRPAPPEKLYLGPDEWEALSKRRQVTAFSPFDSGGDEKNGVGAGFRMRRGRDFAPERAQPDANVFDAAAQHIKALNKSGKRALIAAASPGSAERLKTLLAEHGFPAVTRVENIRGLDALEKGAAGAAVLPMEAGFEDAHLGVIAETDILGERMVRAGRRPMRPENFIAEASSLAPGDLVVHAEHGVGRFEGLETIAVERAPHDCLRLIYAGGDKLFLPVENLDILSRFGSESGAAALDRLGSAAWQARKARLKDRIREIAGELIKIAAARALRRAPVMTPPAGAFDEFCAAFPFTETEDQLQTINAVVEDLGSGRPTDRLVCGDVGFGKTEVALRAAFIAAMSGRQVAVVTPTTLLCRQHWKNFAERFRDFPVRVAQISRLVSAAETKAVKEGLAKGVVDVVIGTHALLAQDVRFADLGLLVVDEEQHFGVSHKERLKALKSDVHVLTLSATPIPRTLQMALTGLKEMSLIATPPVDRLAVRTFTAEFDPVVIRDALMREKFRGGQAFYVCPRIEDLSGVQKRLAELAPEMRVITAHGRLTPSALEDAIGAFADGAYDLLLSTNIIESGLDMPRVNTLVIHRADQFGLAQLYQLRGRVGRSKVRAYAYMTLPPGKKLTPNAARRLEVMQTLDTLGAGFSLASHDLDIRGAGNLLGEEQSGHIREVGIELYQNMLEEAVAEARGTEAGLAPDDSWSPQISTGLAVLIPERYAPDLTLRMGLYRRLAGLKTRAEIDAFAAELADRFGELPPEAENLLKTVELKLICREAGVAKIDTGPKGAVVSFRNDTFANPAGLVDYLTQQRGTAKLRPDHRLVLTRDWETPEARLNGARILLNELRKIATAPPEGA
ncbi:MAG: transcription-repair coupling factor [Rhodospirillales bacterium]